MIGILNLCDAKIYHIKCMWDSDLHFMVQWFCLISWKLFDGLILYWRHWFSVTNIELTYICRSVTYISWSSDFALYLEDYLMDKCHNWNIGSMWCKDLPPKMFVGQWPTFHGPVTLSWRLLNGGMLYWIDWFSATLSLTYKYTCICRSVTYILWYSDSALHFKYCLMNKPHSLDIGWILVPIWAIDLYFMS